MTVQTEGKFSYHESRLREELGASAPFVWKSYWHGYEATSFHRYKVGITIYMRIHKGQSVTTNYSKISCFREAVPRWYLGSQHLILWLSRFGKFWLEYDFRQMRLIRQSKSSYNWDFKIWPDKYAFTLECFVLISHFFASSTLTFSNMSLSRLSLLNILSLHLSVHYASTLSSDTVKYKFGRPQLIRQIKPVFNNLT